MGLLGRADLLKKQDLAIEMVPLDGDDFVFVREMTAHEKDEFESLNTSEVVDDKTGRVVYKSNFTDYRAKLAVFTVCDEAGNNVFKPGDYTELGNKIGARKLAKIIAVARKLNKLDEMEIDSTVKNFDGGKDDAATSDSV